MLTVKLSKSTHARKYELTCRGFHLSPKINKQVSLFQCQWIYYTTGKTRAHGVIYVGACSTWCLTIHNYLPIWKAAFVCPETLDKSKFVFTEFACGILFSCKASDYSPLSKVYQARKASRYGGPYLHPLFPSFPDFRAFLALILTISHQREICEDVFQRFKRPRR